MTSLALLSREISGRPSSRPTGTSLRVGEGLGVRDARLLPSAKLLFKVMGAEVDHGGAAMGASVGAIAGFKLPYQFIHLMLTEYHASTHRAVAGEGGSKGIIALLQETLIGHVIQDLKQGLPRIGVPNHCGNGAKQISPLPKGLKDKSVPLQKLHAGLDQLLLAGGKLNCHRLQEGQGRPSDPLS